MSRAKQVQPKKKKSDDADEGNDLGSINEEEEDDEQEEEIWKVGLTITTCFAFPHED